MSVDAVEEIIKSTLKLLIQEHTKLNEQIHSMPLGNMSMEQYDRYSKKITKSSAKVEAYNAVLEMIQEQTGSLTPSMETSKCDA